MPFGRLLWVAVIGIIAFFVIFSNIAGFYTDLLWFRALDLTRVFWVSLLPRWILFIVAFVVAAAIVLGNWLGARSLVRREPVFFDEPVLNQPIVGIGILLAGGLVVLLLSAGAGSQWDEALRYWYRTPFGSQDPIFGLDVGFYVFELPIYHFAQGWLLAVVIFALLGTAGLYALARLPQLRHRIYTVPRYMRVHLTILGALVALLWSLGYWLDRYDLLYSWRGVVFGASYTDIHAELLALNVLAALAVLVALLVLANLFARRWILPVAGVGLWLVANIALRGVYPAVLQNYVVEPNEFDLERPYIEHNIASTLEAYDLDSLETRRLTPETQVTVEALEADQTTLQNVRLWDYRPLQQTYEQLQEIRSYYNFVDVDIDRYTFDGNYQQMMLAARELDVRQLQNQTWVNTHLEFTHGYGLVMSPVNEVTPRGLPVLVVKDLPPQTDLPLEIERPQIYYGEQPSTYVFVKSEVEEFDYPAGDANVRTSYEGKGGVSVGSFLTRLAFAYRFGDSRILFTDSLTPDTRVMMYRNVQERLARIAPFLRYDRDPYLAVVDGRLVWIQDAYTVSDRYPYSEPLLARDVQLAPYRGINYIRNSVKIAMTAYDGRPVFYVADPDDPLIQTWAKIFPNLFVSMDQMPDNLRQHRRYPEDLFRVQADIYRVYHMQNPNTFYNREDVWAIPIEELRQAGQQPMEPYYVIMELIGEDTPEFVLMVPFTPVGRDNMIAWMAGRSDEPNYGELIVYEFPKQELIYGPQQIEALIDQDPDISAQLSLWSQRGSDVIRGNLLVFPIGESLLYVEPLYLRAENGELPELKRVIVSTGGNVAWSETLGGALARLLGATAIVEQQVPGVSEAAAPSVVNREIVQLVSSVQEHWDAAQDALGQGNWALYGEELQALEGELQRLAEITGAGEPAPEGSD